MPAASPRQLTRLAESAGATLREVPGFALSERGGSRKMRVFQIIAPLGAEWLDTGSRFMRVEWATGSDRHAKAFNSATLRHAVKRLKP